MESAFKPPERVGFVGVGQMGYPMARNLARAGFRLCVADANPDAVKRFAAEVPCETPSGLRALGSACRVVITMLPDGEVVRRGMAAGGDCVGAGTEARSVGGGP